MQNKVRQGQAKFSPLSEKECDGAVKSVLEVEGRRRWKTTGHLLVGCAPSKTMRMRLTTMQFVPGKKADHLPSRPNDYPQ